MLGLIMYPRARKLGGRDGGLSALTDHLCAHFTLIARAACKLLVVLKQIQPRHAGCGTDRRHLRVARQGRW